MRASIGTADNGNVMGITNNRDNTRSQTFSYDALNRILTAQTASTYATSPAHCWAETYSYDVWGNLLTIASPTNTTVYNGCVQESGLSVAVAATNRVSTFCYDASGNLLVQSSSCSSPTYAYNGESQLTSTAGVTYTYDGDGKRVKKSNGKLYWYGAGADPLDETDASGNTNNSAFAEYIFFDGKRIARRDSSSNVVYYLADHLGTARVVTNASGTIQDDSDFYAYGAERAVSSSSGNNYKFDGKERDTESGLDDFGARYYSSQLGRFASADWSAIPEPVPYANLMNPQTLNLYAIVHDNPETFADLDGHLTIEAGTHSYETEELKDRDEEAQKQPQNQPLTSVTVLGNTVGITYGSGLTDAQRLAASDAIAAAAGVLNKNAGSLTGGEKKAVGQISSFSVVGPKTDLGATGKGSMTLSIGYIGRVSAPWLGSLFGHEGQHYLNAGKYSGANLWRDEQSAGRTQLGIGNKIGFSSSERQYLEQWIDDRNRAAMQQHMENGYQY